MPGLDPGSHCAAVQSAKAPMEWIAGSSPAMTNGGKEVYPCVTTAEAGVQFLSRVPHELDSGLRRNAEGALTLRLGSKL